MQKETYKIKCPKHIVFGDPLYFEEYPGMMHRTMTIFLAPHDHMDVYLSNHKYAKVHPFGYIGITSNLSKIKKAPSLFCYAQCNEGAVFCCELIFDILSRNPQ